MECRSLLVEQLPRDSSDSGDMSTCGREDLPAPLSRLQTGARGFFRQDQSFEAVSVHTLSDIHGILDLGLFIRAFSESCTLEELALDTLHRG